MAESIIQARGQRVQAPKLIAIFRRRIAKMKINLHIRLRNNVSKPPPNTNYQGKFTIWLKNLIGEFDRRHRILVNGQESNTPAAANHILFRNILGIRGDAMGDS